MSWAQGAEAGEELQQEAGPEALCVWALEFLPKAAESPAGLVTLGSEVVTAAMPISKAVVRNPEPKVWQHPWISEALGLAASVSHR